MNHYHRLRCPNCDANVIAVKHVMSNVAMTTTDGVRFQCWQTNCQIVDDILSGARHNQEHRPERPRFTCCQSVSFGAHRSLMCGRSFSGRRRLMHSLGSCAHVHAAKIPWHRGWHQTADAVYPFTARPTHVAAVYSPRANRGVTHITETYIYSLIVVSASKLSRSDVLVVGRESGARTRWLARARSALRNVRGIFS